MTSNDENAKNPKWKVPMEQSSVKPEDYSSSIDSANGSANTTSGQSIQSDDSGPGQEEGGRMRQPNTSSAGRIIGKQLNSDLR